MKKTYQKDKGSISDGLFISQFICLN